MKIAALLVAVIFGCITPTYSQININRKADSTVQAFSFYPDKKNHDAANYRFTDKFSGLLNDSVWDSRGILAVAPVPSKIAEKYSGDNMPCFKPEGSFAIRVYKPDSTVRYTILLKKY